MHSRTSREMSALRLDYHWITSDECDSAVRLLIDCAIPFRVGHAGRSGVLLVVAKHNSRYLERWK